LYFNILHHIGFFKIVIMNEATDVKFMSVVKDACCNACIACSYSLVIFMVARFSAIYKQDLRATSEIALINSGYSNGHIFVEQF